MRPLPGDDAFVRQRSTDDDLGASANLASTSSSQMSFFLADESFIDSYLDQPSVAGSQMRDTRKLAGSGHILACERDDMASDQPRSASIQPEMDSGSMYSPLSTVSLPSPTPVPASSSYQHAPLSRPITPITLGTSVTGSLVSGPSSRRNSFVGSVSANAISFDDDEPVIGNSAVDMVDSGSAPQLVMPSIKMPSRRPFTATGKSLGRLKVLCAGASKTGKTSLLKSIVQTCEHIVHVDPIVPQAGSRRPSRVAVRPSPRPPLRGRNSGRTEAICEIFGSTKSYPEWWAELGHETSSQRRKSLGDQVLDRNICFVDTPGYRPGPSAMETIVPCVEYVESHLSKVYTDELSELERLNLLGGGGGLQVDVVLYLIQRSLSPVDIEYLKRLSSLTNVIPLLAQSDTMSVDEQALCKQQIRNQLSENEISFFSFTTGSTLQADSTLPTAPYTVSSATGSDHDVMDASLLMSPDYVQPLASSELSFLISHMFSPSGSSWLRHSAAKKYLQWRDDASPSRLRHLYQPLSPGTGALISRAPLTMARVTQHHAYHVDNAARRIELVDWAADLQRSLAHERARHEIAASCERDTWPNECVASGTIVPTCRHNGQSPVRRRRRQGSATKKTSQHQDPLGLLQVLTDLKTKGWIALEVLGGIGVLGGLAYYLTRQNEPTQTADDWARLWGFDI
ncbi:hypothetical protein E8E14_005998 [Neopestalotiopsis sp. 37M]|nr:hypothetical protein E8E14_005998 [Neopestalotiopsis sp. 37M]